MKKDGVMASPPDDDDDTDSFVSAADSPSHQQRLQLEL